MISATERVIVSSGRMVATIESPDSFVVVAYGSRDALGCSVHGPFKSTDDRFSQPVIPERANNKGDIEREQW